MEKLSRPLAWLRQIYLRIFWKTLQPGEAKRQFNTATTLTVLIVMVVVFTIVALIAPAPPKYVGEFREKLRPEDEKRIAIEREKAIAEVTAKTQSAFTSKNSSKIEPSAGQSTAPNRNSSMILNRPGVNSGTQLAAGQKFTVRLLDKIIVGDQTVPVIAEVTAGVFNDGGGGILEGSRLFGTAQFQGGQERAQIQFQSIADPSGVVRNLQAIAIGEDGQMGVSGETHSNGFRNAAGQFVTRFAGAYAEGSQQRDFMGNSQGGATNGLLNAVAQTAKDRTDDFATDLKKQHEWIELTEATAVDVILTQPFVFREPGSVR